MDSPPSPSHPRGRFISGATAVALSGSPAITIESPTITIESPTITIESPTITIESPTITIESSATAIPIPAVD
ncbi:MAG: hypothetical protein FJ040_10310 [Chloroflexi bacterium]|nr:hypothetical protein [Chloroflexota bacterium]